MKVLIFRTDISTINSVQKVASMFDTHSKIHKWFVDLEDIDNVLKIKANTHLTEDEVQHLVDSKGFYCEPLPD